MEGFWKVVLIIAVVMYVISPLDAVPGAAIDDLIVIVLGWAAQQRIGERG